MSSHRERADIAAYRAAHPDISHTRALNAVRAGWRRPGPDPRQATDPADAGGISAMLDHSWHHLADASTTEAPAVLVLARAYRAVIAISAAAALLVEHCVPTPQHHPPIVDHAEHLAERIAPVIGNYLLQQHRITGARPTDPLLFWAGPDLRSAERRMLAVAELLQLHCDRVARDDSVLVDQRRAAAATLAFAGFVGMQLGGPMSWMG
ncbi:hypothetical protein IU487_33780 [Nocardia puris]|uniref:hypothetical protein n=1 Tax=Nocardia puris TaxID=208602 RepID=UPI0018936062|nr:hypothetical protein [Nocardia puris]MBF6215972.1 hypothetical protein [Nocardia puris]